MINYGLKKLKQHKRFIIFCMGGGFGAIINWIISFILTTLFSINYVISYSLAQIINISFNFIWNRSITFRIKCNVKTRFLKFIITSIATASLSILLVFLIKEFILDYLYKIIICNQDLNYLAAIIIVTFIVAVINYLINKYWVFEVQKNEKRTGKD